MTHRYTGKGTIIEARGNKAFLLEGAGAAWVVLDGAVDVFSVRATAGEPEGPRRHLARFEEGRVLFGVERPQGDGGRALLAVGIPGTRVVMVEVADLLGSNEVDLAHAVDAWIEALEAGVFRGFPPTGAARLVGGVQVSMKDGAVASPGDGVLWLKQREGRSLVCGDERLALETTDPYPYPVSGPVWVRSVGAGVIDVGVTSVMVSQGDLARNLNAFHAVFVDSLEREEAIVEEDRRHRLRNKLASAQRRFEGAIWSLASTIRGREDIPVAADADDFLVKACRLVAGRIGMEIAVPPGISQGRSLQDPLDAIAAASRLRIRQVQLTDGWWRKDNGPLLGFSGPEREPVALLPASPRRYVLVNPRSGKRVRVSARVAAGIDRMAHTFYRHLPETKIGFWGLLRFGLFANRNDIAMIILLGAAGGLLGTLLPIFTGTIFDSVIPSANRGQLAQIGMALAAGAFAAAVFEIARAISLLRIEGRTDGHLQSAVIDRLLTLPAPFFRGYTAGDLGSRAMGISAIRSTLSGPAVTALLALVFSGFSFFLLFIYDAKLAMLATLLILLALAIGGVFTLAALARQRVVHSLDGQLSGMLLQYFTGIAKLKVAGCERRAFANWAEIFARKRKLDFKVRKLTDLKVSIDSVYPVFCSIVIFWGVQRSEGLSTGIFLAFNAAFVQFMTAAIEMAGVLQAAVTVIPLYDRLRPIIQTLPEVSEAKADPGLLGGRIELSRVSFRYTADGPEILRDVSMRIEPGEFVAVVGPSGSGKSTIFRLLLGFETPGQGAVYYDGQDLADLDIRAVRRQLGVVLQNSQVMAGDLYSNIVGASSLSMDDAMAAAVMAGLEEDLDQMPMGLNTVVPAGGGTLSGGQRQRLMIARAIVKRPRILLFDEATSALDNRTQAIVSKSLASLTATRVVIAHRLSTIINADRIFVVEKGIVVQSGTYQELLSQEGPFAEIAKRQIV